MQELKMNDLLADLDADVGNVDRDAASPDGVEEPPARVGRNKRRPGGPLHRDPQRLFMSHFRPLPMLKGQGLVSRCWSKWTEQARSRIARSDVERDPSWDRAALPAVDQVDTVRFLLKSTVEAPMTTASSSRNADMLRTWLSRLALVAALAPASASAVTFEVPVQGSRELTIAFPQPQTPGGDVDGVSATIWTPSSATWSSPATSTWSIPRPTLNAERALSQAPSPTMTGASSPVTLAKTRVLPASDLCDPAGAKVCVDVYVYDVTGGEKLAGRRLRARPDNARALGHAAAWVVLRTLVGDEGFFDTHIAAVGVRGSENKEIFLMGIDGQGIRPVTRNGSISLSPSWSADGRQISWTSYKRGNPDLF